MSGVRLVVGLLFICSLLNVSCFSSASQLAVETQEVNSFTENLLLSTDDNDYEHHVEVSLVITDNGTLFAGWKNAHTHNGAGVRVSITKSGDGGTTWTQPFDMPMFGGAETEQSDPWLAWHDGTLYYAYLEVEVGYFDDPESGDYFTQMTVAKSIDYGDSWTPVKATNATHFADKETFTVADDGTIYLVYDDVDVVDPLGDSTVRLSISRDGGESYTQTTALSEDPGNLGPYVTTDSSGNVYVAWTWFGDEGGNLLFSRSTDGGLTFSEPVFINDDANSSASMPFGGRPGKVTLPVLRFDQNERLYVLWDDMFDQAGNTFDVYLRYSDDFGETWSNRIRVNPFIEGHQWNPEMAIDEEGILHFAYYDESDNTYRPWYRTLNFTGPNRDSPDFTDAISIADVLTSSDFTRPGEYLGLRIDSSGIPHVAWSDGRSDEMDIYYAHGSSFIPTTTTSQPLDLALIVVVVIVSVAVVVAVIVILRRRS
ncbi:MAG: exo-alpha-sialidase [Candidatus Thorarchaeota archaeon]|nr:exo-alpha-sialidase [Candidatus Thorarchaeota archaeon]